MFSKSVLHPGVRLTFQTLAVKLRAAAEVPTGKSANGWRGAVSLLVVDLAREVEERIERLAKLLAAAVLHPGARVLLLGGKARTAANARGFWRRRGFRWKRRAAVPSGSRRRMRTSAFQR